MSTLVTPSARSHERVKGRWVRETEVTTRKEWFVYYTKHIVGTPIPWLMAAFVCLSFVSKAGLEIAGWTCSLLTALYILVDQFSANREFRLFRIGADFFLLGYVIVGIIGAYIIDATASSPVTLGGIRWVLLLYLLTYTWQLFPGLNRLFYLMIGAASFAAVYGIWQHFTGVDLVRSSALEYAPVQGHPYFTISGFFGTPEVFATLMAAVLPFPAAAFLLSSRRHSGFSRAFALGLVLLFSLALLWTYRPGLWIAGIAGLVITLLAPGSEQRKNQLALLATVAAFLAGVIFISYSSVDEWAQSIQTVAQQRAEEQRLQINTQVELWQQNTWIGVGDKALEAASYDPGTGNVYFQVLAQSGVLGGSFYLLFILSFLLMTYRMLSEVPVSYYWHRVLLAGGLASQIAFHVAGLYWSTLSEAQAIYFYVFILSALSYLSEHYDRGLVPDDQSL